MSAKNYEQARKAFEDNLQRFDAQRDPAAFDLYAGLLNLTLALRQDMHRLETLLEQLRAEIRNRG